MGGAPGGGPGRRLLAGGAGKGGSPPSHCPRSAGAQVCVCVCVVCVCVCVVCVCVSVVLAPGCCPWSLDATFFR